MGTATGRARIALPIEACWEKLRDLRRARYYVRGVSVSDLTTERSEGVGASRRVVQDRGGALDETVTEWKEGEGFTIRLHRGARSPAPFREASFRYALVSAGPAATDIVTTMTYTLPLGGVGRLLDRWLLQRFVSGTVQDVAARLARHYETDAPVPRDWRP